MIDFQYDDGGRAAAGFKGDTGDCACRAVAIATGRDYRDVYDELVAFARDHEPKSKRRRPSHPRTGYHADTLRNYLAQFGLPWTPTMQVGSGCQVHLTASELPAGRLIVQLSKHFAAVIDGVLHDTYDSSRGGTRCVYGYWTIDGDDA